MLRQPGGTVVRQLACSCGPSYCDHLQMKEMANTPAAILLFAIALFSFGPQLGSLDIDGDGVPDVPLIVFPIGSNQNVQAEQSDGQERIALSIAPPLSGRTCNDRALIERRIAADLRTSGLELLTPLRC